MDVLILFSSGLKEKSIKKIEGSRFMKKKLVYILVFVLVVFLMLNYSDCVLSGNTSSNDLTDSEKALIIKFGYGENYVKRWPDGIVYVYNGTMYKGLPKIIKQMNQIISNKTIFELSDDKEISKVVFESYVSNQFTAEYSWYWKGYFLDKWAISVSNQVTHHSKTEKFFLSMFVQIAGFNYNEDKKNTANGGNFQWIKI
jgi:hypothetical protein